MRADRLWVKDPSLIRIEVFWFYHIDAGYLMRSRTITITGFTNMNRSLGLCLANVTCI